MENTQSFYDRTKKELESAFEPSPSTTILIERIASNQARLYDAERVQEKGLSIEATSKIEGTLAKHITALEKTGIKRQIDDDDSDARSVLNTARAILRIEDPVHRDELAMEALQIFPGIEEVFEKLGYKRPAAASTSGTKTHTSRASSKSTKKRIKTKASPVSAG